MTPETIDIEKPLHYKTSQLLKDLWKFIRPYKTRFFLASIFRLLGDSSGLYFSIAMASLVNFFLSYQQGNSLLPAWITLGLFLLASLIYHSFRFLGKFNGFRVAERAALDAHVQAIEHLVRLDISWHERENAGNKLKRIQKASIGIDQIVRIWFNHMIQIAVDFVGIIFILATFDRFIGAFMVVFLVTFILISKKLSTKSARAAHAVNIKEEDVFGLSFEIVNNIRTVKIMSMMQGLFGELRRAVEALFVKVKKRITRYQTRHLTLAYWVQIFRFGTFAFIIYGISQGRFELGLLVLFDGYFNRIRTSVDELAEVTQDFEVAKYGIGRLMETLAEPVVIDNEQGKVPLPSGWQTIEFKNVSFGYGDKPVLQDVSFKINKGERIGIVGLSGAGKSTLFKLLLKEHENFSGSITFDTVPVQSISKEDYFEHVAVVLQETEVFNFSLRDNITLANQKRASDQSLLDQSLSIAHVSEFLKNLPKGLDTYIGEKGIKLSGGEKQRLGIARAIFKQPDILLLDEATSHLDLESEERIKDSLHTFFQDVTAVVIAHRLTTIKEMDRILVLEDGRLIESGSFSELYEKKGRFFELWEKQKL